MPHKQKPKSKARPPRRCKYCGAIEQRGKLGYTNIAPFLGACMDCIIRAMPPRGDR